MLCCFDRMQKGIRTLQSIPVNLYTHLSPFQVSNMTEPCATPVVNSQSLAFAGNVRSAPIMTFAQLVTMETSIT